MSSGVETSHEISPCATLSRDDGRGASLSRDDKIKKKKGTKNYGK